MLSPYLIQSHARSIKQVDCPILITLSVSLACSFLALPLRDEQLPANLIRFPFPPVPSHSFQSHTMISFILTPSIHLLKLSSKNLTCISHPGIRGWQHQTSRFKHPPPSSHINSITDQHYSAEPCQIWD